jgi:hypothetical protein
MATTAGDPVTIVRDGVGPPNDHDNYHNNDHDNDNGKIPNSMGWL